MARLYRQQHDSSRLPAPRVLARVLVEPGRLPETVRFYERLTGVALDMDLDAREHGLHLVVVGGFLLLDLDPELLGRADEARRTAVTVVVADLDDAVAGSVAAGSVVVSPMAAVMTGRAARLRHPDGLLVEYVEHRPGPDDVDHPGL